MPLSQSIVQSMGMSPAVFDDANIDGLVQDCSISSALAMEI